MKKRILSILMLLVVVMTSTFGTAFAADSVPEVYCQYTGSKTAGGYGAVFYVVAKGTTCKLKFTCTQGSLDPIGGGNFGCWIYGSYEVKVVDCVTGAVVKDQDIYCTNSKQISFNAVKGRTYKILVWCWKPETIAKSYVKNGKIRLDDYGGAAVVGCLGTVQWNKFPTIKATNASNCILYKTKP